MKKTVLKYALAIFVFLAFFSLINGMNNSTDKYNEEKEFSNEIVIIEETKQQTSFFVRLAKTGELVVTTVFKETFKIIGKTVNLFFG